METVRSKDGTNIAYAAAGSGPPLVLVHGTSADHSRWLPVSPAFEQKFTAPELFTSEVLKFLSPA